MTTIMPIRTSTTTSSGESGSLLLRVGRRGERTVLDEASGHVPYAARAVNGGRPGWLRIVLVQTIAGPLAGDRVRIEVEVGPGAALEIAGNAATVALPCEQPARQEIELRVRAMGRLAWLPEPVVLTAGCDLESALRLELEPGAAAVTREQVVLGRVGEVPGRHRSRVRCELERRPLLHDEIRIDGREQASAAVLDGASAFGSLALLGLEPESSVGSHELRLAGGGRVLRALAPDAATLRQQLVAPERAWLDALAGSPARATG